MAKVAVTTGLIGQTSYRPDILFSDQVSERDIIDLRNSSHKVQDYKRLLEREFNKAVAGTVRGQQKEAMTFTLNQSRATTVGAGYVTIPAGYTAVAGSSIWHNGVGSRIQYQSGQNVYISPAIDIVLNTPIMIAVEY